MMTVMGGGGTFIRWQLFVASQNCRKEGLFLQKRLDEAIRERIQNGGIVAVVG